MPQPSEKRSTRARSGTSSSSLVVTSITSEKKKKKEIAPSKPKTSSSSSSSSSSSHELPTFPVEILTEIIKLALGYPFPPTAPYSPPTPTAHKDVLQSLLLASRTLRAVALPLVFRSITICRSRDWLTFFEPGRGIFVAGEEGVIRRRALKEINLSKEAVPPLCFDAKALFSLTISKPDQPLEYLAPLEFQGIQIESLTILTTTWSRSHELSRLNKEDAKPILAQIVANVVNKDSVRAKARRQIARDERVSPSDVQECEIDDFIESTIQWSGDNSQGKGLLPLIRSLRPRLIRLPMDQCSFLFNQHPVVIEAPIQVVVYREGPAWSFGSSLFPTHQRALKEAFPFGSFETDEEEKRRIQKEKEQQKKMDESEEANVSNNPDISVEVSPDDTAAFAPVHPCLYSLLIA
ncbi:hypothetical protein BDY24DRAFT_445426 [Mrakia frigida]|uniref:uncharacterized protein n=1 Tax=Mrakia frigida TaxID=29902 RepID=UPI003FCC122A